MTIQLTFNEKSDFGRNLLKIIQSDKETTYTVDTESGKAQTASGRRKKRILNEIRQSVRHANELEDSNAKTYTLEELIESL